MPLRAIALLGWIGTQAIAAGAWAATSDIATEGTQPAPFVVLASGHRARRGRGYSARHGWLLRSNSALGLGRIDGVPVGNSEYHELHPLRFATTNHLSIGYGWRPNWALTLDGFRAVVPHYPHPGNKPEFAMRVDTETLGLGFGSTVFIAPWSMHVGSSIGIAMSRIGGDLFTAPTHRGIGSLSFAGFELMRSQGIGVVLGAQIFGIIARRSDDLLTTRTYAVSLGVTYW